MTKADKLSKNQLAARRSEIAKELAVDPQMLIACSAVTKQGIEEVRREIAKRL
jgi:GTP-binding protein EngB required for normal cell division